MPFASSATRIHNDDYHTGSAKRGAANGVAPLDASAEVPMANLKTGGANELCALDANARVPFTELANLAATSDGEITDYEAGSDTYHAHDAEVDTTNTTYTKVKTITLGFLPNGTLRLYFEIKNEALAETTYGRIYRNGVAVGTEQSVTGTTYTGFTENISGWSENDTLELYIYTSNGSYRAFAQNFRILCTKKTLTNS